MAVRIGSVAGEGVREVCREVVQMTRRKHQRVLGTMLAPTDGSECSEKPVSWAGNLAKKLSAKVHVMFVSETNYAVPWYYYVLDDVVSGEDHAEGQGKCGRDNSGNARKRRGSSRRAPCGRTPR